VARRRSRSAPDVTRACDRSLGDTRLIGTGEGGTGGEAVLNAGAAETQEESPGRSLIETALIKSERLRR